MEDIKEILETVVLEKLPEAGEGSSTDDIVWLESSDREKSRFGEQYDKRDTLYAHLLDTYIHTYESKSRWNKWYKLAFFSLSLAAFVGVIGLSLTALIIVALHAKDESTVTNIAVVISSMAGIISSIVVLPKIIAKHLFPMDEDEKMIEMVKHMQLNDSRIRSVLRVSRRSKKQ